MTGPFPAARHIRLQSLGATAAHAGPAVPNAALLSARGTKEMINPV